MTVERGEERVPSALVEAARLLDLAVEVTATRVLLEETLTHRARALVGVLLGPDELRHDVGRARRPAEADAGKNVLENVPAWTTTSGARLQRLGGRSPPKDSSR